MLSISIVNVCLTNPTVEFIGGVKSGFIDWIGDQIRIIIRVLPEFLEDTCYVFLNVPPRCF